MHALEKETAAHSNILAWRIPGTEEPGGLLSMGSQSWIQLKRLSRSIYICVCICTFMKRNWYQDPMCLKASLQVKGPGWLEIWSYANNGLPWWFSSKESACNEGELGSSPGSGRSPGGGHGNPFQHSCLENPMDRGTWQATVHGIAKSQTQLKQLSIYANGRD